MHARLRNTIISAVVAVGVLSAAGCADDPIEGAPEGLPGEEVDIPEITGDEQALEAGELAESAEEHIGEPVVVRGAVTEVLGDHGFVLGDRDGTIAALAGVAPREEGEVIDVFGRVRWFDPDDMEARTGIDFSGDHYAGLVGETVLQVQAVYVVAS